MEKIDSESTIWNDHGILNACQMSLLFSHELVIITKQRSIKTCDFSFYKYINNLLSIYYT